MCACARACVRVGVCVCVYVCVCASHAGAQHCYGNPEVTECSAEWYSLALCPASRGTASLSLVLTVQDKHACVGMHGAQSECAPHSAVLTCLQ